MVSFLEKSKAMAATPIPWISPDEFLDYEESADTKHMYYAGTAIAMAGGTLPHATLSGNLLGLLHAALRSRGCRVVGSDVLFQTGSQQMFTYPDVMVLCGPVITRPDRRHVVTNPVFVAEVLSPSTEAIDRGAKSREYRASPSLRQYALLSQDKPLIEFHTRDVDGTWRISEVEGLDADCEFSSLGCRVPMRSLYEAVLEENQ
jgi:Uma2 family endonuclease